MSLEFVSKRKNDKAIDSGHTHTQRIDSITESEEHGPLVSP